MSEMIKGPALTTKATQKHSSPNLLATPHTLSDSRTNDHVDYKTDLPKIFLDSSAFSRLLNSLPYGVIGVNDYLEIVFMNNEGCNLLRQNDGLGIDGNRLSANNSRKIAEIKTIIRSWYSVAPQNPSKIVQIPRPSLRRPFELIFMGINANSNGSHELAVSAIIFIFDHSKEIKPTKDMLSELYGLTAAESHIVILLIQGKTLDEISTILHKAKETLRKQLRSIFDKTNTNRQSELVRLLLMGPTVLNMSYYVSN